MAKKSEAQENNTQDRLLEAAIDIFGRHGYDAATTRMIARTANVNISAIPYYFGGKEGLYRAVIDHIVSLIATPLAESNEQISRISFSGKEGKEHAVKLLDTLLTSFIMFIVGSPQASRVAPIILREQLFPSSAYDIIYSGFMSIALNSMSTLLMFISGETSEKKCKLRAMTLLGQVLVFRVARETAVRALNIDGYSSEETEQIRTIILEHTKSITSALISNSNTPMEKTP